MKTKQIGLIILLAAISFTGCKKKGCTDHHATNYNSKAKKDDGSCTYSNHIVFEFDHEIDGAALNFNDKKYVNAYGNQYSVENLKYFISKIVLHNSNGTDFSIDDVHYRDALDEGTRELTVEDVPDGHYTSLSFIIGLDESDNITGGLSNTIAINNMEWPVSMGGGYHYMKLEGKYADTTSSTGEASYNFHTGALEANGTKNHHHVAVVVDEYVDFEVADDKNFEVHMVMNINEWFANPNTWDFKYYGAAIMGNEEAQTKIMQNGANVMKVHHIGEIHEH